MKAADKRAEENLGLVRACANRFKGRGIEYEELYSAGCLGLVKAANNFDEARGFAFSTYAVPVILGEIKQLFRDGGAVKVSRGLKELALKANRISAEYLKETGEEITVSRLAEKLGVDAYRACEALGAGQSVISLTYGGEGDEQADIPVDSKEEFIAERLSLEKALSELESTDRKIIELRYYRHKTQTQTARLLGMTQVQISRREKKILIALRQKLA